MRDKIIMTLPNGWIVTIVRNGSERDQNGTTYEMEAINATKSKEIGFGSKLSASTVFERLIEIRDRAD